MRKPVNSDVENAEKTNPSVKLRMDLQRFEGKSNKQPNLSEAERHKQFPPITSTKCICTCAKKPNLFAGASSYTSCHEGEDKRSTSRKTHNRFRNDPIKCSCYPSPRISPGAMRLSGSSQPVLYPRFLPLHKPSRRSVPASVSVSVTGSWKQNTQNIL